MLGLFLLFFGTVVFLYKKTSLGFYIGIHLLFLGLMTSSITFFRTNETSLAVGPPLFFLILLLFLIFILFFCQSLVQFFVVKNNLVSSHFEESEKNLDLLKDSQ